MLPIKVSLIPLNTWQARVKVTVGAHSWECEADVRDTDLMNRSAQWGYEKYSRKLDESGSTWHQNLQRKAAYDIPGDYGHMLYIYDHID